MPRFLKNISKKTGAPPGTLIHVGEKKSEETAITLMEYSPHGADFRTLSALSEIEGLPSQSDSLRWLNIDGLHDMPLIESVGRMFDIHPLSLEDIVNTGHRPKVEIFDNYVFVILKMLRYDVSERRVRSEQLSLIIFDGMLISFQEQIGDLFDPIRQRIQNGRGRLRHSGIDYLSYALMDNVVDHYYYILESFGDDLETLEQSLIENPEQKTLERIHELKRETLYLRKQIWPLRETIGILTREDSEAMSEPIRPFLRDVHDHTIQIIEIIESYRDILTGLIDLYMSGVGNRMNEVMKVLTIIATIFIPITFVAGIYGMNFKVMPELDWRWGYGGALGLMAAIAGAMVVYFKRKNWW
jgi:magnesium transporter